MLIVKKPKLQVAVRALRKQYHDSISADIIACPEKSYSTIAQENGVSLQLVVDVAKMRGIGRNTPKDDEVGDGE